MVILVYTNIQGYQNEMAELVRAFFPGHTVKLVDDISEGFDSHQVISCQYEVVQNRLTITVMIYSNGQQIEKHVSKSDLNADNELEYKKTIKNFMKLALYDLLEKFTGYSLDWGSLTGIRPVKIVHELMDRGLNKHQIMEALHEQYRVSAHKSNLLIEVAEVQRNYLKKNNPKKVAVYINIPICTTKCLYCSFPSDTIDRCAFLIDDYITALISELKQFSVWIKERNIEVETIYIGGGTPTSLNLDQLNRLLDSVEELIVPNNNSQNIEYTVEGGRPDSMNREKLMLLKSYGVNRISINPQTMNRKTLSIIGRSHTPEQIVDCFLTARDVGFESINMDLIVGLPEENENDIVYTMEQIKKLKPDNITIHTLAIKRTSILKDNINEYSFPDASTAVKMLDICKREARAMGMIPYYLYRQKYMLGNMENVGFALPGKECIYNIQIMEEKESIWAFGAGAVTRVYYPDSNRIERVPNVKNIEIYIDRIDEMIKRKQNVWLNC